MQPADYHLNMAEQSGLFGVTAPLAARMRPRKLEEVVGQAHLLLAGSPLQNLADGVPGGATSVILWGPPGSGKTTIAKAISASSDRKFVELSAVSAGVKDVRDVIEQALSTRDLYGQTTVLFLDEIHRFTKAQQDALLPGVENGWIILVAATTENPSFSVITPLLSRSLLLTLEPLNEVQLAEIIDRALSSEHGLRGKFELSPAAKSAIIQLSSGDARRALTLLEASAAVLGASTGSTVREIDEELVAQVADRALLRYDRQGDEHYDVISAFIKSVRGSDPDAAIHYLARMIEAGEDPRFIARRILILAAEDIGLADPQALVIANAAADSVQFLGMPEARIPLAEAAIYLSTAPKSNAAYLAIDEAIKDVRNGQSGPVPKHLRDSHYPGAKALEHGKGYIYPHDEEFGVARQQYPPSAIAGKNYYNPTNHGLEKEVAARLEKLRRIVRGD